MELHLSELQKRVYDVLAGHPDEDVPIPHLYQAAYGEDVEELDHRTMQMRLGAIFQRLNPKLEEHGERIKPGALKRTYRLDTNYRG